MADSFTARSIDSPRLSAEMLLSHVTECDRLSLYTDPDRPASPAERSKLRSLVARALGNEPIQYLVREAWFFSLPLTVTRVTLIPRPATESLVEHALHWLRSESAGPETSERSPILAADIGTGSGAIAIALAKNNPALHVLATDVSADALAVARDNAARHGVTDRVELLQGDLLEPIRTRVGAEGLDLFTANPPYISDDEWAAVAPNVKDHEPALALRAGPDGLDIIKPLLRDAPDLLRPGGLLLIEHAASHADQVRSLARDDARLSRVETLRDFEALPRVLKAERVR